MEGGVRKNEGSLVLPMRCRKRMGFREGTPAGRSLDDGGNGRNENVKLEQRQRKIAQFHP